MSTLQRFKAFRIHKDAAGGVVALFEQLRLDDLTPGEVVVRVRRSSINYKDALAATGKGKILRRFPLVGGIDLAGEVVSSTDKRFRKGQKVLATGSGLGEDYDGGYAEYARVRAESVIPMPRGLDASKAMGIGTAGFTAALAIHRMEHNGLNPKGGPVVVTGATGGVGSLAVDMLSGRGYEVVAVTGKADAAPYLRKLGAHTVLLRQQIDLGARPLERAQWQGAIDSVGGDLLTWLTRSTDWWGSIASIGLAGSHKLETTVMPFILRGVSILGINSMATPRALRLKVWGRIATDLKPKHLTLIANRTVKFEELPAAFDAYLAGQVTGRAIVKIG